MRGAGGAHPPPAAQGGDPRWGRGNGRTGTDTTGMWASPLPGSGAGREPWGCCRPPPQFSWSLPNFQIILFFCFVF